jgi:aldose 1-epimerase
MRVTIINYGATVTSVHVADRDDRFENVTLGFSSYEGYLTNAPYFGSICGRYANRIAGGKFSLDGIEYKLATNNGVNHLHGGNRGFNHVLWTGKPVETADSVGVELTYISKDGEEGYPGTLNATVVYTLNNANELSIDYTAVCDKATPVNLTNHCYWNLAGAGDVLDQVLMLNCDRYLPVDSASIPTGELKDVRGTPMDFTEPAPIGSRIDQLNSGYDHCYVLREGGGKLTLAARASDPKSGRVMEVHTTEPGIQLYTGNYLDGSEQCAGFARHSGFCVECQHFPDSPNRPEFPNTILRPGEVYRQTTMHRFSVDR